MSTQSTPQSDHTNRRSSGPSRVGGRSLATALADWQIEALQKLTVDAPLLITDDDPMSRTFYRTLLSDAIGLNMVETWSPNEALRICQTQPISLVISCILKPVHMDGLDLAIGLRADPQTQHIPLLIVTATMHTRELALQAGANAYLNKPCHPNDILQAVWQLLRDRVL